MDTFRGMLAKQEKSNFKKHSYIRLRISQSLSIVQELQRSQGSEETGRYRWQLFKLELTVWQKVQIVAQ